LLVVAVLVGLKDHRGDGAAQADEHRGAEAREVLLLIDEQDPPSEGDSTADLDELPVEELQGQG
jgi:hypothetical protein